MSYGDYVEQLTYLLFLKMDQENSRMLGKPSAIPPEFNWAGLLRLDGEELESHYRAILSELGKGSGLIPVIFRKAQNKIQDPAKLRSAGRADRRRDLDRAGYGRQGRDLRRTAGKERPGYQDRRRAVFHPAPADPGHRGRDAARAPARRSATRPAARAVSCWRPTITSSSTTPLDRDQWQHLRHEALHGWEIVDNTARLCVMNLYLHGIGANGGVSPIHVADSLAADPGERFDMVLTNPPFGKKSSVTYRHREGEIERESRLSCATISGRPPATSS